MLVYVFFHFREFFEVEVNVDDELVKSGVFEPAEVLLDVGEVRVKNLDGVCDFGVSDFGVAPEHLLLPVNLLVLL